MLLSHGAMFVHQHWQSTNCFERTMLSATALAAPASRFDVECPTSSVQSVPDTAAVGSTDAASEDTNSTVPSSPERDEEQCKAAARAAKKNRSRMLRYHREKKELSDLRLEASKLQAELERLGQESQLAPLSTFEDQAECLATTPSPFVNDSDEEIDPRDWMPPKAAPASRKKRSSWKATAHREFRRRSRGFAVRRKLMQLICEYKRQTDNFVGQWVREQVLRVLYTAGYLVLGAVIANERCQFSPVEW